MRLVFLVFVVWDRTAVVISIRGIVILSVIICGGWCVNAHQILPLIWTSFSIHELVAGKFVRVPRINEKLGSIGRIRLETHEEFVWIERQKHISTVHFAKDDFARLRYRFPNCDESFRLYQWDDLHVQKLTSICTRRRHDAIIANFAASVPTFRHDSDLFFIWWKRNVRLIPTNVLFERTGEDLVTS